MAMKVSTKHLHCSTYKSVFQLRFLKKNSFPFVDVAVGAPYEDMNGVVYIFNGSADGLSKKPAQVCGSHFPCLAFHSSYSR